MNKQTPKPLTEAEAKELAQLRERVLGHSFLRMLSYVMGNHSDFVRMNELEKKDKEFKRHQRIQQVMSAQPLTKAEEKEAERLLKECFPESSENEAGWIVIDLSEAETNPKLKRALELVNRQLDYQEKVQISQMWN